MNNHCEKKKKCQGKFFLLKEEGIVLKCPEILTGKSYKLDVKIVFILLYL